MTNGRRLTAWLAVVAWAGVIFWLSSIPSLSTGLGTWDLILRKGAHVTEYAILMLLLVQTGIRQRLGLLLLGMLYAGTDEWHQTYVEGRAGRPRDVLIDTIGLLIGLWVASAVARARRTARSG
ncbi:MAG: VanZ family protein [Gaiellales bacterium]